MHGRLLFIFCEEQNEYVILIQSEIHNEQMKGKIDKERSKKWIENLNYTIVRKIDNINTSLNTSTD